MWSRKIVGYSKITLGLSMPKQSPSNTHNFILMGWVGGLRSLLLRALMNFLKFKDVKNYGYVSWNQTERFSEGSITEIRNISAALLNKEIAFSTYPAMLEER